MRPHPSVHQASFTQIEQDPIKCRATSQVAADAIPDPAAQQLEGAAAKERPSIIPTGNVQRMQNLVFPVRVKADTTLIAVDGKTMLLSPGMDVTVEVKTGKRRILEYLFSPLAEISSQAMQER